jgi:uncharacterized protein
MGILFFIALIAVIFVVFAALVRRRVQSTLERRGHQLPAELRLASARPGAGRPAAVGAAPVAAPAAAGTARLAASPTPVPAGLHFLLIYDVGPDFIRQRAQFRDEHLALAWKAVAAGELLLAGALEEPTEQAFLLFRGTREAAHRFAAADPYVRHGLVRQWRVKQWHTVAGEAAALPLRPKL